MVSSHHPLIWAAVWLSTAWAVTQTQQHWRGYSHEGTTNSDTFARNNIGWKLLLAMKVDIPVAELASGLMFLELG